MFTIVKMWWEERDVLAKDLFISTASAPKEGIRRCCWRQARPMERERGQATEPHPITHSFLAGRVAGKKTPPHWVSLTCPHVPKALVLELIKLTLRHLLQTSRSPGKLIPAHAASNVEDAPIKSACIFSRGVAHIHP